MLRSSRIMLLKNISRFLPHQHAQMVVELAELARVGLHRFEAARFQPLAAEVFHQRVRLRVLQHARDLSGEHGGIAQRCLGRARSSSASGMLAHRKYESREASSYWLMR